MTATAHPARFPSRQLTNIATLALACLVLAGIPHVVRAGGAAHGIAMHGSPALPADFKALPYVNPDAPKGGQLRLGALGTYDSLNPFIVKGVVPQGLREYVYESLLTRSSDEPFSLYGLVAESIEVPADRTSATFVLRQGARFSDGKPITVDDIITSQRLLASKGLPFHRSYYSKIARIEHVGERGVRFVFSGDVDRELPLIVGLMPIIPAHRMTSEQFERTSLEPPIGSGPYRIDRVEAGRTLIFRRNPDWWGRDLPINRGRFNFDEIRYDFFRDATAMAEAFTAGDIDVRAEDDPVRWAERYENARARGGRIERREIELGLPAGMSALVFNTRRAPFNDQRVRQALIALFDADWVNRSLYHGLYRRTDSYFARSELAAAGKPADARERELLAPFPDAVKPEIMAGDVGLRTAEGSNADRAGLAKAMRLLQDANYRLEGQVLANATTHQPLTFEFLAVSRAQERLMLTFAERLRKAGVTVRIRQVDNAQYWSRLKTFDFDMIQWLWPSSLSPGNEQINRWSSAAAEIEGSLNYPGVKSAAGDAMIKAMLETEAREGFVAAVRAFDRVLMSGDYVIPLFYAPGQWIAYWDRLGLPDKVPLAGMDVDRWWLKR